MRTPIDKRSSVEKTVELIDGEYCVIGEESGRNFGCFETKEEAEERLAQIERFKNLSKEAGEAGIHNHELDRANRTTANDGAHSHLFELPDGTVVETELDGAHTHRLFDERDNEVSDGGHTHRLVLPDGTSLVTESDGSWHFHALQVDGTALDGVHTHALDLPGQGTLTSLTPGEFWERQHRNDIAMERPVHVTRRVKDGKVTTELAIAGDKIIEVDTAKQDGADPGGRDILRTYSIDGDRFAKSLCVPNEASFRFPSDEVEGVAVPVDQGHVELGMHRAEFFEYFISKSGRTNGILLVAKAKDGKWASWLATEALLPAVLDVRSVRKGWMPPAGEPALPESLASIIPDEFRYWEIEKADEARAVRDALVESRFMTEENVRMVNGELRKVYHKLYLYEPTEKAAACGPGGRRRKSKKPKRTGYSKRNLSDTLAPIVGPRDVATTLLPDDDAKSWGQWVGDAAQVAKEKDAVLHLCQPIGKEADGQPIAEAVAKLQQDFIVALVDSPENRSALNKVGAPFKLRYGDQRWVYACSFPVAKRAELEWLDPSAALADLGLPDKVTKTIVPDGDSEERFVLGIVLEPETIDAQNDIYSAAEIRQSAHKFMENFQNMGLMHQALVNNGVRILESFIAPVEMTVADVVIKQGTWLLAVRVVDDGLWVAVKQGELTGFSIGGSAIRVPD